MSDDVYAAPKAALEDCRPPSDGVLGAWKEVFRQRPGRAAATLLLWPVALSAVQSTLTMALVRSIPPGLSLTGEPTRGSLLGSASWPLVRDAPDPEELVARLGALIAAKLIVVAVASAVEVRLVWRLVFGDLVHLDRAPKVRRVLFFAALAVHFANYIAFFGLLVGWVLATVLDPVGAAVGRERLWGGGRPGDRLRKLVGWFMLQAGLGAVIVGLAAALLGVVSATHVLSAAPLAMLWLWMAGTVLLVGRSQLHAAR